MDESYISHDKGGTMFAGPDAVMLFQAIALRSGLGLFKVGIKPGRGWTIKRALQMATSYTRKPYKRTEIDRAMADLALWIHAMRSALPIIKDGEQ